MKRNGVLIGVGILAATLVAFAGPPKDTLVVTALDSTSPAPTVSPVLQNEGGGSMNYFYVYAPADCSARTFPVQFQLNNTDPNYSGGATVSFNAAGGIASGVTLPASFSINESDGTVIKNIVVTPPCAPGDYLTNIQVMVHPNSSVIVEHSSIHFRIRLGDPGQQCFLTDSSYNLLTDCSGAEVWANGTFQIVTKANGKIVATNPGQFYYNLIWTNPGASQPITINLTSSNLVPHGANAVHAMVFDSSGFVDDKETWDMVNQNGTPCGPSGPCTVTVGTGQILWVTWHLQFSLIGSSSTGIANTCGGAGSVAISATGTLSTGGSLASGGTPVADPCTASASGYLKPR
ncbi:MAG: hypothetical protein ACREUU_18580 [Gammaproteobacteria bacterium]